jgi:hypothetical protein
MKPRNRFQGMNSASLCSLAGRYDNPIPTRFPTPIDCLKIPAQEEVDVKKDGRHKKRNEDYVRDKRSRERIGNVGKERGKVEGGQGGGREKDWERGGVGERECEGGGWGGEGVGGWLRGTIRRGEEWELAG